MSKGFWDYLSHWQKVFPRRHAINWREGWLQNGYCRDCRYCCGPQDSNELFPMGLLPEQLRPGLANDFYLLNRDTAFMDGGVAARAQIRVAVCPGQNGLWPAGFFLLC
jgi:hypothetical protein